MPDRPSVLGCVIPTLIPVITLPFFHHCSTQHAVRVTTYNILNHSEHTVMSNNLLCKYRKQVFVMLALPDEKVTESAKFDR